MMVVDLCIQASNYTQLDRLELYIDCLDHKDWDSRHWLVHLLVLKQTNLNKYTILYT